MRRLLLPVALCSIACAAPVIHPWRPRAEQPRWLREQGFTSVGDDWSCAKLRDGDLDCWGRAKETWVPFDEEPKAFLAEGRWTCFVDPDDDLVCKRGELRFADVWHYDSRSFWTCAASRCGAVSCSEGGEPMPVLDLDEYVDEVYLREDGVGVAVVGDRVYAWDPSERPLRARRVFSLDAWSAYVVIRTCTDAIEDCARRPLPPVDALRSLRDVELERAFGCGLDDDGRVRCAWYGEPERRDEAARFFGLAPDEVEPGKLVTIGDYVAESVGVGSGHACAVEVGGAVHCWGRNEMCQAESSKFCGYVWVAPNYEGVPFWVSLADVEARADKTYVVESGRGSEVEVIVTAEEFERVALGETVAVAGRYSWTHEGVRREHPEQLWFRIGCAPARPTAKGPCE